MNQNKIKKLFFLFSALTPLVSQPIIADGNQKSIAVLPPSPDGKLQNPLPSGVIGNPETPLSSEEMPLSSQKINTQVQEVIKQAKLRMSGVNVGDGNMPDVHEASGTLDDEIRAAKELRAMNIEQAKVKAAIELWKSAYDGKRENPKKEGSDSNNQNSTSNSNDNVTNKTNPAEARNQALEEARQEAELAEKKHLQFLADRKNMVASIPPVISSIYGSPQNLKASILVPYIGERTVMTGSSFSFIDGSIAKVQEIKSDSVTITHNKQKMELNFGNHVPSRSEIVTLLDDQSQKTTQQSLPGPKFK